MWEEKKTLVKIICVIIVLYLLILPAFWPRPRLTIEMPSEEALREDLPISVSVNAWHSNFSVAQVRFLPDPANSTAFVKGKELYILELQEGNPRSLWKGWQINRITWPRSRRYQFRVPVQKLSADGTLKTGELKGNIAVQVAYAAPHIGRRSGSSSHSRQVSNSIPMAVRLY